VQAILKLAYKLLVNDKAKLSGLLVGITFAVFLMIEMTSLFAGVLNRSSSAVYNIGARMWVMDPAVNTVANSIGMPDYVLDAVRSIHGVKFAVPLYSGGALVRLNSGTYQPVTVVGIDDTSLFGRPRMLSGRIQDLYGENAFIVIQDAEFGKLENPHIGTEFEVNDHRGVIVGIGEVASSGLFGVPTLYTTYRRAVQYLPSTRYTMSYILIEPKTEADIAAIERAVDRLGYRALTREEFIGRISHFYTYQTGLGTNILLMTVISFVVGLSISGQTFYTFVLENIEKFGALKAIGARGRDLVSMIMFQALFTGLIGFGLGVGLATTMMVSARLRLPDYASQITYGNIALAFGAVLVMAAFSSYIGVRKVLQIQPFDIFRG